MLYDNNNREPLIMTHSDAVTLTTLWRHTDANKKKQHMLWELYAELSPAVV